MRVVVHGGDARRDCPAAAALERQLADAARAFAASGHEVLRVGPTAPDRGSALARARAASRLVAAVAPAVARFAPDVVYEVLVPLGTAGRALARATGARHVVEVAALGAAASLPRGARALARRRERQVLAGADLRIAPSRAAAAAIDALAPGATVVAPGGIDAERLRALPCRASARRALGLPEGAQVACLIADLHPRLGLETAVRAIARMPDVVLLVAGDGPLRLELEALAATRGACERVRFLGGLLPDEADRVLAAADLAVATAASLAPSGAPAPALLDYLAAGLPIVGSAAGAVAELLADEPSAVLVPPDDEAVLAAGIAAAAAPDRRVAAARARERALVDHAWERRAELILGRAVPASRRRARPSARPVAI